MTSRSSDIRDWDLVIYGATGDAGTAVAIYVANNLYNNNNDDDDDTNRRFRWAIAGRSERKLNQLRSRIIVGRLKSSATDEFGIITADSSSIDNMNNMAKSTRILVSAVGPYTTLGENIYSACVKNGTHYTDITGEVDWVYLMREKYKKRAKETGSTLCSFAGYDCVPCNITMHLARSVLLNDHINDTTASASTSTKKDDDNNTSTSYLTSAETVTRVNGGTFPRGTIRTMISKLPEGAGFARNLIRYSDGDNNNNERRKTIRSLLLWLLPRWSPEFGAFTLPHFMGWCNIPVVHNSLGSVIDCVYHDRIAVPYSRECLGTGYGLLQILCIYAILLMVIPWFLCFQIFVISVPTSADFLLKLFDSLQYRGNSPQNQKKLEDSTVEVWTYVTSSLGSKAKVHMFVNGDPGIKCTSMLAAETAFSMLSLLDKNQLPKGIIGSPSMIVGDELVKRLQDEGMNDCTLSVTTEGKKTSTSTNAKVYNEKNMKKNS
mmetsp:Transcript_47868/g.53585  ORF Transcript_47868/g.53585 Transcript_47868/m.53585 type:complete len:490 (+) Transcript_47868:195-1664(+)